MKIKKNPSVRFIIAAVNAVLIIAIVVSAVASHIISYQNRDESPVSRQVAGETKKDGSQEEIADTAKDRDEALSAYSEFLQQDSIEHGSGDDLYTWYLSNCQFAVADIDDDDLPELFLYDGSDHPSSNGYGTLYTYKDGKIQKVCDLSMSDPKVSGYYKKTGWFVDSYEKMGTGMIMTMKLNRNSADKSGMFIRYYNHEYDDSYYGNEGTTDIDYVIRETDGNDKNVEKSEYDSKLKKATGGKELTVCEFHDNYSENREEYLK